MSKNPIFMIFSKYNKKFESEKRIIEIIKNKIIKYYKII